MKTLPRGRRSGEIWHKQTVTKEKKKIKDELDKFEKEGMDKRLNFALLQIKALENPETNLDQLRRFLYIVSALFHHVQHSGLTMGQVRDLSEIGTAILQTQGIRPPQSKVAFLYADLHMALSQIYRIEGEQWRALWEQELSHHLSEGSTSEGKGYQSLSMARRAIRLGHVYFGIQKLEESESYELERGSLILARLERIKALRLAGFFKEAGLLSQDTIKTLDLKKGERLEFEWESLCREAYSTKDVSKMVRSVRRGQYLAETDYIVEAFLWSRAVSSREWIKSLPKLKSFSRGHKLGSPTSKELIKFVRVFEQIYDYDFPFTLRLEKLTLALGKTEKIFAIDSEVLIWAAAARWFARSKCFALATIALDEYRGLSLRMSDGHHYDCLGIMADLFERDWYGKTRKTRQSLKAVQAV